MSDPHKGLIQRSSAGGRAALHPDSQRDPLKVAPAAGDERNTMRMGLFPIACWRLDDIRFDFDSSFLRPEAGEELTHLAALIANHPRAPLSVFGHADPVGNDEYNKQLAGRRAAVIYGLLTRDTALWERLYRNPFGRDDWSPKLDVMRSFTGRGSGPARELFQAYMDKLCVDENGQPFRVEKSGFLARGADPGGKGDYQGCSEFNPILLFSAQENAAFADPNRKDERDFENAPNRRVVVFLFRPGSLVHPARWPCPRATEGTAACRTRFWSDGERRRSPQAVRRQYEDTGDTFACRFYDRLAGKSPCEGAQNEAYWITGVPAWGSHGVFLVVRDEQGNEVRRLPLESGDSGPGHHRTFDLASLDKGTPYRLELQYGAQFLVPVLGLGIAALGQALQRGDAQAVKANLFPATPKAAASQPLTGEQTLDVPPGDCPPEDPNT